MKSFGNRAICSNSDSPTDSFELQLVGDLLQAAFEILATLHDVFDVVNQRKEKP